MVNLPSVFCCLFVSVQSLCISWGWRSAVHAREQWPPFSSSVFCKYSEESWAHATYSLVEKSYKTVHVCSGKGQISVWVCLLLVIIEVIVHQLKMNKEERLKYCVTVRIWEKDKKLNKNILKINGFFSRWFIHKRMTSVIYNALVCHHCWQKHSSMFLQEVPNVKWNMKRATSQMVEAREWATVSTHFWAALLCICAHACSAECRLPPYFLAHGWCWPQKFHDAQSIFE